MTTRLTQHSNDAWLAAVREGGSARAGMVEELRAYLRRVLAVTLRRRGPSEDDLDELTQEAFSRLLSSLHSFRGDSAFPTWAVAVATRVAFTEMRRREARQRNHARFERARADALRERETRRTSVLDAAFDRRVVLAALEDAIESDLTDRQKVVTLALLRGVPTVEIAERTHSNPNAVHKLAHDARLRLRTALERRGVTMEALDRLSVQEDPR